MPDERHAGERLPVQISRRDLLKLGVLIGGTSALPAASAQRARVLLRVPRYPQERSLSCEMAALRSAAAYFQFETSEALLLEQLPIDRSQPRWEGGRVIWSDPNRVFPGNVHGAQLYYGGLQEHPHRARRGVWGYGVHAEPIAELATRLGLRAEVFDEVDAVYHALRRRRLPIVIVPWGGRTQTRLWSWFTAQGDPIRVMNAQHAVAVAGYDRHTVWVHDPALKIANYAREDFEKAFNLLRSGVIIKGLRPSRFVPS